MTDRSVIIVTTEQGDKVKEMQMQQKPPVYFDIDNNQYKLAGVSKVEYLPEEPMEKLLPEPPRCHGQKSIHLVIYEAYKKRLREGKHLKWEEFRKKTYNYIYEQKPNEVWCDNRKGTCVCEENSQIKNVMKIMGGGEIVNG